MSELELKRTIQVLYDKRDHSNVFEEEFDYLCQAYHEIETLWNQQLQKIEQVKHVMLSEAPLWGNQKKYLYNPATPFSQYFYKSDLEYVLERKITDKQDFLEQLAKIGFIILDLSPYPLNKQDTSITYPKLSKPNYLHLVQASAPFYLEKKVEQIKTKMHPDIRFFFRYKRASTLFSNYIKRLLEEQITGLNVALGDIAQQGGGIDRSRLASFLNASPFNHN